MELVEYRKQEIQRDMVEYGDLIFSRQGVTHVGAGVTLEVGEFVKSTGGFQVPS